MSVSHNSPGYRGLKENACLFLIIVQVVLLHPDHTPGAANAAPGYGLPVCLFVCVVEISAVSPPVYSPENVKVWFRVDKDSVWDSGSRKSTTKGQRQPPGQ